MQNSDQSPSGRVIAIYPDRDVPQARIAVTSSIRCARCEAGKGCGAGLLGSRSENGEIDAYVAPGLFLSSGDRVTLSLQPSRLLRAAWIAYGYPLVAGLAGALFSLLVGGGDSVAAGSALVGLVLGFLLARLRLRNGDCLSQLIPTVSEIQGSVEQ